MPVQKRYSAGTSLTMPTAQPSSSALEMQRPRRLFLSPTYPMPAAGGMAAGAGDDVIALSASDEEFTHLGANGELIHRVSPSRSYFFASRANTGQGFTLRAAEKVLELRRLWCRNYESVFAAGDGLPTGLLAAPFIWGAPVVRESQTAEPESFVAVPRATEPVRTVDLICCTFNRETELPECLPSIQREIQRARVAGIVVEAYLVYQNEGTPERLRASHPALVEGLHFVPSFPAGLTRARNAGVQASRGELVVFIDDDVRLDPDFIVQHVEAANQSPHAYGVAGRIRTPDREGEDNRSHAIGQIRLMGHFEDNFESSADAFRVVPMTPRGANMAFRRSVLQPLLGSQWFDELLTGSAHREETTLAVGLLRRGLYCVFAPKASLLHVENVEGGCENRTARTAQRRLQTYALEYRFLMHHFFRPFGWLRFLAPLRFLKQEVKLYSPSASSFPTTRERLETLSLSIKAYWNAVDSA